MRASRPIVASRTIPRIAWSLALAVLLSAFVSPLAAVASPTANELIASQGPPPLVTKVCVVRSTGVIRAPKSGSCRAGEKRVSFRVAKPRLVCRTTSRAVRMIGSGGWLSQRECRTRGTVVRTPAGVRILMCRSTGGALRWIKGTERCGKREDFVRLRNGRPYALTLSDNLVLDRAPAGTTVGQFAAKDFNGDAMTWSLVTGRGATDNAAFRLRGNTLVTTRAANALVQRSYSLRARARDIGGRSRAAVFTVQVAPLPATAVTLSSDRVAENSPAATVVGQLGTLPKVLTGTSYSLAAGTGDTDNALFSVTGRNLVLTAGADHEATPTLAVRIRSVDDRGVSVETALTVQVTDVNEAPTSVSLGGATVAEHRPAGTTVGALTVADPDAGDTFTWQVDPSTDFTVDGTSLVTLRPLSHRNSPLSIQVTATDSGGLSITESFQIQVTDVVDAPTDLALDHTTVAELVAAARVGTLSASHDDGVVGLDYTLVPGTGDTDNDDFAITGDVLSTTGALRQSDGTTRSIRVRVTARDGGTFESVFEITVSRTPTAPSGLRLTPGRVAENALEGTSVGTLAADDPNINESHRWEFVSGTGDQDNDSFVIDGTTLRTDTSFNFEDSAVRSVRVKVIDADGETNQAALQIAVTDVEEAPTGLTLSGPHQASEGVAGVSIGLLSATDPENQAITFSLPEDADDNDQFQIDGTELRSLGALAYADGATRVVRVRATDAAGEWSEKSFTITVLKDAQAPTGVTLSHDSVAENSAAGTRIGTLTTLDPNPTDQGHHTYQILGSLDAGLFALDGDDLVTAGVWNFEDGATRQVTVRTTDPDNKSYDAVLTVHVTDVNEAPTTLALSGTVVVDGAADVEVGTVSATDVDAGDTLTYHLVEGAGASDNGSFVLDQSTGVLRTRGALRLADGATRTVRLEARDSGGLAVSDSFVLDVRVVPRAPTDLALSVTSFPENLLVGSTVGTFSATDVNTGDTFTYDLVSGPGSADNGMFTQTGGALVLRSAADHETAPTLHIRVEVTDSTGLTFSKALTLEVTDVNEAPHTLKLTGTTVPENSAAGTVVGTLSGVDPEGDTITWTGASSPFGIDGNTLTVTGDLDFETRATYPLELWASDGARQTQLLVTIQVTNVNEAPHAITASRLDIDENNAAGAVIGTLSATDPDAGDTRTWRIVSGRFTVLGNQLKAGAVFDHETAATETVTVEVTDSGGLSAQLELTVKVNDVDEAPVVGADGYQDLVGNVSAVWGDSAPSGSGPAQTLRGAFVLANDSDPEGQPVRVAMPSGASERVITTSRQGTVTIAADGQFRYAPAAGVYDAEDTFSYPVTDGTLTTTGQVTLTVLKRRIWFVDPSVTSVGEGTSASPYKSVSSLQGSDKDDVDDEIFVSSGTHALPVSGFTLESGQQLYGGAAGVQVGATQTQPAMNLVAPGAPTSLVGTGAGLVLAEGTKVSQVSVTSGTGTTLSATNVNAATVAATVSLTSGSGAAVAITGGSGALSLPARVMLGTGAAGVSGVSIVGRSGTTTLGPISTSTNSSGVSLEGAGTVVLGGALQLTTSVRAGLSVTNTTLTDSVGGHRITTTSGTPVSLANGHLTAPLTFTRITSNGAANGIKVVGTTGSPLRVASTAGARSSIANSTGVGVLFDTTAAPSLANVQVTNGAGDGVRISDSTGSLELTDSSITGNAQDQVQVAYGNAIPGTATITGNTIAGGTHGLLVNRDGTVWDGALALTVSGNTVSGSANGAVLLGATGMPSTGGFNADVANNTIGTAAATSCSSTGNGLEVSNEDGTGVMVLKIRDNVVKNCQLRGIQVLSQLKSSVHATITNNTVSGSVDAVGGIALDLRVGSGASDTSTSCFDVRGNTLTSAGTLKGAALTLRGTGGVGLPQYGGAKDATGAVETYLASPRNTSTAAVTGPTTYGTGFVSGTCTTF